MERSYYLAVDIGASSGRHILGWMEDGKLKLEEVYRFANGMEEQDGVLCWNVDELFFHITEGMKACRDKGKIPVSMGIDTWAVDFVLLDGQGEILGQTAGYRDDRTRSMDELVYRHISPEELYGRTGIQKQIFNTVYQLMAVKEKHPEQLWQAKTFLMIPDYFHYRLTGQVRQEYTNATTTQLVSTETKTWDYPLIERLGYPKELFGELSLPGTPVGHLTEQMQKKVGYNCRVVLPPTHDTASAVLAVPSLQEKMLYISSGTWSLMGVEQTTADCSRESFQANMTNEGGYGYRYRYLKNIMGLWMIQSVRKEWMKDGAELSFAEICENAARETITSLVDCNEDRFLAPQSMIREVQEACRESGQQVPQTRWEIAAVIYNSLADCYRKCAEELETLTGETYDCIHIVGGGANADYLNRLTAKATGKTVYAGPTEATAVGNLMAQMMADGVWQDVPEARRCIYQSFDIQEVDQYGEKRV